MHNGQMTPLRELSYSCTMKGNISITPHDPSLVGQINNVLKAYGLNSYVFSKTSVAAHIPQITGEEKTKVHKQIKKLGEDAKIAVRNIRKNLKRNLDKLPADEKMNEQKRLQDEVDEAIREVDIIVTNKINSI